MQEERDSRVRWSFIATTARELPSVGKSRTRKRQNHEHHHHGLADGLHEGVGLATAGMVAGVGAVADVANKGVDAAVDVMDFGVGVMTGVTNIGVGVLKRGVGITAGPIVQGLQNHVLPRFAPVAQPILTPFNIAFKRLQQFEANNHMTIQALPHTVPMVGAVLCILLMLLPIQDSRETPQIFLWAVTFTLCGLLGWLLLTLVNDYSHFRHGLLPPQRPRTVLGILLLGVSIAVVRIVHLTVQLPPEATFSTEWLQRVIMG
jgi:hypothetical protein